jgi:hypothetical protein
MKTNENEIIFVNYVSVSILSVLFTVTIAVHAEQHGLLLLYTNDLLRFVFVPLNELKNSFYVLFEMTKHDDYL